MSTKITVKYNSREEGDCPTPSGELPDYHLYQECFDDENIYLGAKGIDFQASPNGITIQIPWKLWNEMVECGKLEKIKAQDAFGEKYIALVFEEKKKEKEDVDAEMLAHINFHTRKEEK